MLLVIDVGNTNMTLGVYKDKELLGTFRMTAKQARTSDEYGIVICDILERRGVSTKGINAVIIASVVPNVMHSLTNSIKRYFNVTPLIVGAGIKTGLRIVTENPKEIGPGRIVNAVAAYEKYGGPAIVIDYGTATTFDLVGAKGSFEAGITAPGIETSVQSLTKGAAMLPSIEIKKPSTILAKETITSMQAGLVYGAIGQAEYIVQKIKEESGYGDAVVVATGGLGRIIANETESIDIYDADLSLEGLRMIYEKNRK